MALAPADTGSETTTQIDRAGVLWGRRFASSLGLDAATLFGLATVASLLVLIEILVRTGMISSLIIALPSEAIGAMFHGETLLKLALATKLTFGMVLAAMVVEVLIAIPAGYLLYRYKAFGKAYEGWLASLFAAPIFLLYPLFMVIFGRNNFTLIFMGVAAGIIPIIVQVRLAFMSVPPTLIKVGRSFHMSESTIFWKIMVPAGAKTIFTGIRLGLIYTLINIIAIEYLVDAGGLGRLVSDSYFRFDITGTYTAIIAVTLVSVVFNIIVNRIEKLVR
jgi:NitT/TauT family transport system permease protein